MVSIFAVATIVLMLQSEKKSNYFINYEAVRKSELIGKGWVPSFIPESAHNINERHRVDVPSIFVDFYFKKNDVSKFEAACDKISEIKYKCINSGYPVIINITKGTHAIIRSIEN